MICDKLYAEMKDQKQAILSQKKRREQAENVMLKESGDLGNVKSRRIVTLLLIYRVNHN